MNKREIKFRVWDKIMEDIAPLVELHSDWVAIPIMDEDGGHLEQRKLEDVELMQYTGFKDKNGKEIYEGDIVRFENKAYEIRFFNKWGMFGLVGKSSYKDFIKEDPLGSGGSSTRYKPYVLGEYYQKRIEVIGNIYENKDLLK